jgi:putative transposase
MAKRTPELQAHVIDVLLKRRADGELTQAAIDEAAATLNCSTRSIFRWMKHGLPNGTRPLFVASEGHIDLYYEKRGNVVAVHAELLKGCAEGEQIPSRQTLDRAFCRQLSTHERKYVRVGSKAWNDQSVTRRDVSHRNEVWEADDKQLPISVVLPRGSVPAKPWITNFVDLFTRAIMGWVISFERPNRASVITALRRAIMLDPGEGPFCGIPYAIRWDNGRNFTSNDTTQLAFLLGCDIRLARPRTPQDKGTVERLNRTLEGMLAHLPLNENGPRGRDGKLFGPNTDPMPIQKLVDEVAIAVREYNLERPHRGLQGRTPLEAWSEDQTPIRTLDVDILRDQLPATTRKVMREGISFGGELFWAPELRGLLRKRVEIRYMPYDQRQIDVHDNGAWLCTAKPHNEATHEEKLRLYEANRAERKTAGERMRRRSRKDRLRLASMHEGSEPEVVSSVSVDALKTAERGRRSLGGEAKFDLIIGGAQPLDDEETR